MMEDISKLLAGIPALDQFNAESTPGLAEVPIQQRVQAFLRDKIGVEWANAQIFEWNVPTGQPIYLAVGPARAGLVLTIVGEFEDGSLAFANPHFLDAAGHVADEDRAPVLQLVPKRGTDAPNPSKEQKCLAKILPALDEANAIVARSDAAEKQRICFQIQHAAAHLEEYMEEIKEMNGDGEIHPD